MARTANQRDLARAAGVSISTVSRALSNSRSISSELRLQIQDLAKELGYQGRGAAPLEARLVRTYVTVNLMSGGLVAFYSALVEALRAAAAFAGLTLEVRMVRHSLDVERLSQDTADSPAAATLLIGLDVTPDISAFFGPDRPMVLVNTFDPLMRYDCVAPNNFYGAAMSAQSLLDAGHRHLLHIREQVRWTTIQRVNGFFSAIAAVPGATGEILDIVENGDAALAAAAKLKASGRAKWTAVHAVHDSGAIRFIHALEEVGLRVPRDASVIGFDDLPAASLMTPRLSTIRVDYESIGRQAIALLLRRIAEPVSAKLQVECGVTPVDGGTISQIAMR